jgi:ABC-type bacteriocin/lantibiotic exporter with double-glycine peptidase domain
MPADFMPVPHYKQSRPGACLPACVRMVMATLGDERSEKEWARVLDSFEFGTPSSRVKLLGKLGYRVQYGEFSLGTLKDYLSYQVFPIVFVSADMLDWADFRGFHALVLVEVTDSDVAILDPALESGPTRLSLDGLLMAWEEFDRLTAIIQR